jgi:hypothetical protein
MQSNSSIRCGICNTLVPRGDGYSVINDVARCVTCTNEFRAEQRKRPKRPKRPKPAPRLIGRTDVTRPKRPTKLKRLSTGAITCPECETQISRGHVYYSIDGVVQCESCANRFRTEQRNRTKLRRRAKSPPLFIGKIDTARPKRRSDGSITCHICKVLVPKGEPYRLTTEPRIGEASCMSCWVPQAVPWDGYTLPLVIRGPQPKPKRIVKKTRNNKQKKKKKRRSGLLSFPIGDGRRVRFRTGRKPD